MRVTSDDMIVDPARVEHFERGNISTDSIVDFAIVSSREDKLRGDC